MRVYVKRQLDSRYRVALVAVALLFNPFIRVELTKLLWVPIGLAVIFLFWLLATARPLPGVPPQQLDRVDVSEANADG